MLSRRVPLMGLGSEPAQVMHPPNSSRHPPLGPIDRAGSSTYRLALAALVASGLAAIMVIDRATWFYFDEWAFLGYHQDLQRQGQWARSLFAPHNEHWSTVPMLVYEGLLSTVGLRSYLPYLAVLVALHGLVVWLLAGLLLRHSTSWRPTLLVLAPVMVFGAGAENLTWAFQIGFVGSVASGLAHLSMVDHDGPVGRRDVAGLAIGLVGLMCSGIAVTMTVVVALLLLVRRRWAAAALAVGPLAVAYGVWYVAIGNEGGGAPRPTNAQLTELPAYVWQGITATLEGLTGLPGTGPVFVVLLLAYVASRRELRSLLLPLASAAGAVALFMITGYGRVSLGVEQAASSRYVYVAAMLMIPLVGAAVGYAWERFATFAPVLLLVVAWSVAVNVLTLVREADVFAERGQESRRLIEAAALLPEALPADPTSQPSPTWAPDLNLAQLRALIAEGALPSSTSTADTMEHVARDLVTVRPPDAPSRPALVARPIAGSLRWDSELCATGVDTASFAIDLTQRGELNVVSPDERALAYVVRNPISGIESTTHELALEAGVMVDVDLLAVGLETVVTLPPGVTACGIRLA